MLKWPEALYDVQSYFSEGLNGLACRTLPRYSGEEPSCASCAISGDVVVGRRIRWNSRRGIRYPRRFKLFAVTMIALMCAHVCEIGVWAIYYDLSGSTPAKTAAFYFAFESYTALGYGNPVPPEDKRLIGPITALNGLLLIGWSVAIIFEVMRIAELQFDRRDAKDKS